MTQQQRTEQLIEENAKYKKLIDLLKMDLLDKTNGLAEIIAEIPNRTNYHTKKEQMQDLHTQQGYLMAVKTMLANIKYLQRKINIGEQDNDTNTNNI